MRTVLIWMSLCFVSVSLNAANEEPNEDQPLLRPKSSVRDASPEELYQEGLASEKLATQLDVEADAGSIQEALGRAVRSHTQAAQQGYVPAIEHLVSLYTQGWTRTGVFGIPANAELARHWFNYLRIIQQTSQRPRPQTALPTQQQQRSVYLDSLMLGAMPAPGLAFLFLSMKAWK